MKIKTIFWIVVVANILQLLPLFASLVSPEFKNTLLADTFGPQPSTDAVEMFEFFALVVSLIGTGIVFLIIGATSFSDLATLRRLSFLFFVVMGFFALPDVISSLQGNPTAPLPVILLGLLSMGLLYYGSKRGKIS